jgi:putative acetyltransferase
MQETPPFQIRAIRSTDNKAVGELIVRVMSEYDCIGPQYSSSDMEVQCMYETYNVPGSAFFVITDGMEILGCGGIAALTGASDDICELRKMYFYKSLRGKGMGKQLLDLCLQKARDLGYRYCYLETVKRMVTANAIYKKYGFKPVDAPMGSTGHGGCDAQYILEL